MVGEAMCHKLGERGSVNRSAGRREVASLTGSNYRAVRQDVKPNILGMVAQ
jgi:hypothetical protein